MRKRKTWWSRVCNGLVLSAALAACTMEQEVELKNATDHEIMISEGITRKGKTSTFQRYIAPGATRKTATRDARLEISIGRTDRYYAQLRVPDAYTANDHSFSPFRTRIAYATLKKDGCIYLSEAGTESREPAVSQPWGFPLCFNREVVRPPPQLFASPKPRVPSSSEISELVTQVNAWSCPVPAGGEHIRPLYDLDPKDKGRIRELRERVELKRRESDAAWEAAFTEFTHVQIDFSSASGHLEYVKDRFLMLVPGGAQEYAALGSRPEDLPWLYKVYKENFDRLCQRRNRHIQDMLADEAALASLRQETNQTWMHEKNRIECRVAAVRRCKRD